MYETRRLVYIGDEEGEIELMMFVKNGWNVYFTKNGKMLIIDGMACIYK